MSIGTGSYPYLGYFNLQQAPFTPVVDDAFFFADPAITQRLEMLRHLVHYSDLLLVVIGEQGSGKTTLLQQFLLTGEEGMPVCRVDGEYGMDTRRLLERIGEGFGLSSIPENASALAEALGKKAGSQPFLLLIDDAHRLSMEALALLLELAELEGPEGRLLRIVLFCEPAINELLADPGIAPLRDRITQTMEMPLFTEEQTAAYLLHRMKVAGWKGESPFSAKLVKMIHKGARGNPARINELAHQALMEISGEEPQRNPFSRFARGGNGMPLAGIAAAVLLVLLIPLFLLLGEGGDEEASTRVSEEITLPIGTADGEETVVVLNTKRPVAVSRGQEEPAVASDVMEQSSGAPASEHPSPRLKGWPPSDDGEKEAGETEATASPESVVEIPAAAQKPDSPESAAAPVIDAVLPDPVPASRVRQVVTLRGSGFDTGSRVTLGWTGRVKELAPEQVEVLSPEKIRIAIVTGMAEDTWTARVTNPDGTSSKIVEFHVVPREARPASSSVAGQGRSGAERPEGIHREAWLMAQDPAHYTVQLMGAGEESKVLEFVRQHDLQGELAYFRGLSQGKDWYSLVAGVYPDFRSANEAAARLAKRLKGTSPWVRRIGNIRILLADLAEVKEREAVYRSLPKNVQDVDWLRRQNPGHYTLQLLAGTEKKSIEEFLRRHGPADGAVYFRTKRGGKDWYALVYNSYRSKGDALAALERLPSAWRKHRPWMRSFASIQKELAQSGATD